MNLQTITVGPSDAMRKIESYRRALKRKANAEYEAILRGYEKCANGAQVIQLSKTLGAGGWDARGRPNLAVARADRKQVTWAFMRYDGEMQFNSGVRNDGSKSLLFTRIAHRAFPDRSGSGLVDRATAMVPIVPPEAAQKRDLSKRLVLFEADWKEPPKDPALLLPLGGDLYAVEAVWDLTDLERAVIAGTRGRA